MILIFHIISACILICLHAIVVIINVMRYSEFLERYVLAVHSSPRPHCVSGLQLAAKEGHACYWLSDTTPDWSKRAP